MMLTFDRCPISQKLFLTSLSCVWILIIALILIPNTGYVECVDLLECPPNDQRCQLDRFGFEALNQLHKLIDDDHDGSLDRSESDEFIRDEMKYEDGFDRHTAFHGSDDLISVQDMWTMWTMSIVYNWTVDDVIDWLNEDVELPQYVENFRINAVDGHMLPRLATNGQYMTSILGIKNGVHKQKLNVKATDIVLFGPPKRHNYVKDLALLLSTVIAIGGFWLAYVQHRYSQTHMRKVMTELEKLQSAEDALKQIQDKLELAERGNRDVAEEKQNLERKLQGEIKSAKEEAERLREERESTDGEKQRSKLAEQELIQVRMALSDAEQQLEARSLAPLVELQQWLQLTYEIENNYFEEKKEKAEKQMQYAKEMCEKIRKKRGAFLGSLRIAHTTSIDDTDHSIIDARAALDDMKMWLQERSQRWRQIENICGFNISINPGLQYLESMLRGTGYTPAGSVGMTHSISSAAFAEEFEEDSATASLPGASDLRERRVTSLRSAFGGSSNSIHSRPCSKAATPTRTTQDSPEIENTNQSANGSIKFDLEDTSLETASLSSNYNKSVSLDARKPAARPKTFNTSLSESALSSGSITSASTNMTRPSSLGLGRPHDLAEEDSSPESTDSTNFLDPEVKEKKKKSKLLKLLRGTKSSKQKES